MYKKLTITLEEQVYEGLHQLIGRGNISSFINRLTKPYVIKKELEKSYQVMANDEDRERDALEWSENLLTDN